MLKFDRLAGAAAPLARENIDTDAILPSRFLKTIRREGLGSGLFADLREDAGFVLNHAPWDKARFLVTLDNFGCGSSREHAPWALLDFGIRCIVAPSFADIFHNNCFKNGILPIVLPHADITRLLELASDPQSCRFEVDLQQQTLATVAGDWHFAIDTARKARLLEGSDDIGTSLRHADEIARFEKTRSAREPWLLPISL